LNRPRIVRQSRTYSAEILAEHVGGNFVTTAEPDRGDRDVFRREDLQPSVASRDAPAGFIRVDDSRFSQRLDQPSGRERLRELVVAA
jgi:hypothetical protein